MDAASWELFLIKTGQLDIGQSTERERNFRNAGVLPADTTSVTLRKSWAIFKHVALFVSDARQFWRPFNK